MDKVFSVSKLIRLRANDEEREYIRYEALEQVGRGLMQELDRRGMFDKRPVLIQIEERYTNEPALYDEYILNGNKRMEFILRVTASEEYNP